jgi:hypothetical protein
MQCEGEEGMLDMGWIGGVHCKMEHRPLIKGKICKTKHKHNNK